MSRPMDGLADTQTAPIQFDAPLVVARLERQVREVIEVVGELLAFGPP